MTHEATRIVGQALETICPADNKPDGFEQVLLLSDGTRRNFHLAELHPANEFQRRRYATSPDGLTWSKLEANPIFVPNPQSPWEKHKVTACQVVRKGDWHLMFYIGFRDEPHAQIGVARSRDGITNWQRHPANPIICPGENEWDHDACYKPYAIFDGQKWLLWYNGRHDELEQVGVAFHEGLDLCFE